MQVQFLHIASALTLTLALGACGGGGNGDGSGGSSDGAATGGSNASGGATTGGQGPSSGGASTGGQAASSGGASSGGSENGTGGSGTGGGSACEDTDSDPDNCGSCGHVCQGACEVGQCQPYRAGCFAETDGFATCTAYCTSIGRSCASNECSTATAFPWPSDGLSDCESNPGSSTGQSTADCDFPLDFNASHFYWRCCCTDS